MKMKNATTTLETMGGFVVCMKIAMSIKRPRGQELCLQKKDSAYIVQVKFLIYDMQFCNETTRDNMKLIHVEEYY